MNWLKFYSWHGRSNSSSSSSKTIKFHFKASGLPSSAPSRFILRCISLHTHPFPLRHENSIEQAECDDEIDIMTYNDDDDDRKASEMPFGNSKIIFHLMKCIDGINLDCVHCSM